MDAGGKMRTIASVAVLAALGFVIWETYKKALAAQNTATGGIQGTAQVAKQIATARPLPFGLSPRLVGGSNVGFVGALQSEIMGLLSAPASHSVPALGRPSDVLTGPFDTTLLYTGSVVPSEADLAAFNPPVIGGVQSNPYGVIASENQNQIPPSAALLLGPPDVSSLDTPAAFSQGYAS